jgi:lipoic acid synthetase
MRRHPDWLKVGIPGGKNYVKMKSLLDSTKLHTICEEAKCPNIAECFESGTAVFLILGTICTRNCLYCNVSHGKPGLLNPKEPDDIAESVKKLGLKYVVITSVTRDDLSDGGASVFANTINKVKFLNPDCKIEVLIPDFKGDIYALKSVIDSKPNVINHNIEVVKELFSEIRPEGDYLTSIQLLSNIKKLKNNIKSKSGFMVGLGETFDQIINTMKDLRKSDVDFLTIGQYLQPTRKHAIIKKYYTPYEFKKFIKIGLNLGFKNIESGPLVRSSYHAADVFVKQI